MSTCRRTRLRSLFVILILLSSLLLTTSHVFAETIIVENGHSNPAGQATPGTQVQLQGDPSTLLNYNPEFYGYVFRGWFANSGLESDLSILADRYAETTTFIMPAQNVHFIADYDELARPGEPIITKVEYIDHGVIVYWSPPEYGLEPTAYCVEDGYDVYKLGPEARSHKIDDMTNGKTYTLSLCAYYNDVKGIVATRSVTAGQGIYSVYFDSNGGSAVETLRIKEGNPAPRPADPVREGHTFKGWYLASDTSKIISFTELIYSDQYYIALWDKVNYTVRFETDGGTVIEAQKVGSGENAIRPADPVKSGFTFTGWQKDGVDFDFATPITAETTLKAVFKPIEKKTVTFDSRGGSLVNPQTVEQGKPAVKPADPVRDQHCFGGWFFEEKRYDFAKPVEADLTLAARWDKVYPALDPKILIGEDGKLNGLLCKAIGLSGTYDPAKFSVDFGPIYPSVRLIFREIPGAEIIFSNPPKSRTAEGTAAASLTEYASRFNSKSRYTPLCTAKDIVEAPAGEVIKTGDSRLNYRLVFAGGTELSAHDYISQFPSSVGLIHVRYPQAEADYALKSFDEALAGITTAEGIRPAISFAAFNLRQTEVNSLEKFLYILDGIEHFYDRTQEADKRLNAEMLEFAAKQVKEDAALISAKILAGQTAENPPPTPDTIVTFDAALEKVREKGFDSVALRDTEGRLTSFSLTFLPGVFYSKGEQDLPEDYGPALAILKASDPVLSGIFVPTDGESFAGRLTAFCRLAAVVETRPAWRDPIFSDYEKQLASAFAAYLIAQSDSAGNLNNSIYESYGTFLAGIEQLDLTLAEGILAKRAGIYIDAVKELKTKIEEKGNVALTGEEMAEFMKRHQPEGQLP